MYQHTEAIAKLAFVVMHGKGKLLLSLVFCAHYSRNTGLLSRDVAH
eukprot:SAG31_NODE_3133_length_4638_cov_6.219432_6_plen_46_part_00